MAQELPPPAPAAEPDEVPPAAVTRNGAAGLPPQVLLPLAAGEAIGVLGKRVHGPAGEDMGLVVDVLVDAEARPRAAVIDFGGFLGVGNRRIAVHWQALQFKPAERAAPVLLSLNRAEVQSAPEYRPSGEATEVVKPPSPAGPPAPPPGAAPEAPAAAAEGDSAGPKDRAGVADPAATEQTEPPPSSPDPAAPSAAPVAPGTAGPAAGETAPPPAEPPASAAPAPQSAPPPRPAPDAGR